MIPIRDENPTRIVPFVTYALIGINVLVFLYQLLLGDQSDAFTYEYALIPASVTTVLDWGDIGDLFSSMFMHGGWAHILGNMLYLWIFGDNVEEALGHIKYMVFYLAGGLFASAVHIYFNSTSAIPTVGASGAIAAVLGAYLVLYPNQRIMTLIPLGFFMRLTPIPAILVLGFWFVLQLFNGVLSMGAADVGGVAFWAHIGGFAVGALLGLLFRKKRRADQYPSW